MPSKDPQDDAASFGEQERQSRLLESIERRLELPLPVRLKEPLRVLIERISGQTQSIAGDVTVTNFPAVQPVSGSVSVPGVSTALNQATEIAALASVLAAITGGTNVSLTSILAELVLINAGIPTALGQALMAASMPVVLASDQSPVPITPTASHQTRSDTFTVAANGTAVSLTRALQSFSIQVKGTGAVATAWDIRLEGSLDGVTYSQILRHRQTTGDGETLFSGAVLSPCLFFRSRCVSVTLGGATDLVTTILGMP